MTLESVTLKYTLKSIEIPNKVSIIGSWNNWKESIEMMYSKDINSFIKTIEITFEDKIFYKFIIDDNWVIDDTQDYCYDEIGNINNVLYKTVDIPMNLLWYSPSFNINQRLENQNSITFNNGKKSNNEISAWKKDVLNNDSKTKIENDQIRNSVWKRFKLKVQKLL
jgi:hypothetical protein